MNGNIIHMKCYLDFGMQLRDTAILSVRDFSSEPLIWSPVSDKWIYELEKIQKNFTSKIKGMEELDYHERLRKLNL